MSIKEKTIILNRLQADIQKAAITAQTWRCCLNCINWSKSGRRSVPDETQQCGYRMEDTGPSCMEYKVLPPPEVLVVGCENYEPDIPF